MICHDLIESVPFSEYSGQLPKHSHHIKAPTWSMRPQRTRASRTLGKTVPCSMTIPGSLRHAPAWILTGIALPLSSAQVPLTHGAPWEDHAEKEVQSIDTYDGKQIVPQLGKSETRPKHRQSASCISLTAMVHPHRLPSRFSKKGTHQNKSATSELKLSFWRSDIYLIYIWVCVSDFVSDCFCGSSWITPKQPDTTNPRHVSDQPQGAGWMILLSWPRCKACRLEGRSSKLFAFGQFKHV